MKLTKIFAILGLGLCLMATSCSKDDNETFGLKDVYGTYSGVFATALANVPYASDKTDVKVEPAGKDRVNITFAEVTGSPARGTQPAIKMKNLKLNNVKVKINGTTATFEADPAEGAGTMNGRSFSLNHSKLTGTFKDKKLNVNLDFAFGQMYERMHMLINGKYEGKKK